MKGFNSIGDTARLAQLRLSNTTLKSRLSVLSEEISTGIKSDIPAATGGNLGRLAQIQSRLALLEVHGRNAGAAQSELTGLQVALGSVADIAAARGPDFIAVQTFADDAALAVRGLQARQDFQAVVRYLNTEVGGRFVLSGSAVTTAPLSSSQDMLGLAKARIAGLTDPFAISTALDEWFESDAPDGFAATAFHGNTDTVTAGVSPDTTISQNWNALDPAIRSVLKALTMAVIASDPDQGLTRDTRAKLFGSSGQELVAAMGGMTALRARVGMQQQMVEEASSRNAAEVAALSIARSDIIAIDPYETAVALTQAETSIQNLYALTARLSRLSLTDYL